MIYERAVPLGTALLQNKIKRSKIMNKNILFIVNGAVIAALYVVLTLIANAFGLANYAIQVRFSEALTILPAFTPAAIPGLFIGCIISNTLTGAMLPDIIFGSLATLIGAFGTRFLSRISKWLSPIPPIVANMVIVPPILYYVYQIPGSIPFFVLTVGLGEIISCGILGMILYFALEKHKDKIFKQEND